MQNAKLIQTITHAFIENPATVGVLVPLPPPPPVDNACAPFSLSPQTLWANFQDICQLMKRQPEHVFSFVVAELGTEGSIDGNQRLVLRGQFSAHLFSVVFFLLVFCALRWSPSQVAFVPSPTQRYVGQY